MKTLKQSLQLFSAALALAFSVQASAYTVYQLDHNYYAIVCKDGQIFSYSGGPGGIGIVGQALCEGHGGIAGGGNGLNISKASAEVARAAKSCQRGRAIDQNSTQCPTRIKVNRWETARSVSPSVR